MANICPEHNVESFKCAGMPHKSGKLIIDTIDMDFVQLLITANNESRLPFDTRAEIRLILDRWENALRLTNELKVVL